jgi:hypothetical protein
MYVQKKSLGMVKRLFKRVGVTDKIYKKFIDTGKVPNDIIRLLAFKVIENKKLDKQEMVIFFGMTSEVNEMIVALSKKSS